MSHSGQPMVRPRSLPGRSGSLGRLEKQLHGPMHLWCRSAARSARTTRDILEHSNHRMAVASLDDDERGVSTVATAGGPQETITISQSGLFNLTFTSRKPEANRFRKW